MKWWLGSFGAGAVLLGAMWRFSGMPLDVAYRQVSPGALSDRHAFLTGNCAACHTAITGPDTAKCSACHANSRVLLEREATAFHASIGGCTKCHSEHRGSAAPATAMDHQTLARLAAQATAPPMGKGWIGRLAEGLQTRNRRVEQDTTNSLITRDERALSCSTCHQLKDRHQSLFGTGCGACHRTDQWTIPRYLHPTDRSTDCVQCHQAPPSHYMMHFQMVSQVVAKQPRAAVEQCYACHLSTRWNDIRGVGWYKHH